MDTKILEKRDDIIALISAVEENTRETGIRCGTTNCVFNELHDCLIRTVYIRDGKCPHYNPALTYADVCPREAPDAVEEDHKG